MVNNWNNTISGWWWLEWNMAILFSIIYGNGKIIPTDELHHFSEGLVYHQPDDMFALLLHIQLHIRHSNPYGYGSKWMTSTRGLRWDLVFSEDEKLLGFPMTWPIPFTAEEFFINTVYSNGDLNGPLWCILKQQHSIGVWLMLFLIMFIRLIQIAVCTWAWWSIIIFWE